MFRTLRAKLIATYVGVAALCLVLALGILLLLARDYVLRNGFKTLDEKKALALPYIRLVVQADSRAVPATRVSDSAKESIRSAGLRVLLIDPGSLEIKLDTSVNYNAEGKTFKFNDDNAAAFYAQLGKGELRDTSTLPGGGGRYQYIIQRIIPTGAGRNIRDAILGAQPDTGTTTGIPGRADLAPVARYIAVIAQQQPQVGNLLNDVKDYITPAILIALAVSILAAYVLGRQISRPVARLAAAARAVGRGDYSQQVPVNGNDEFATLTRQFNEMTSEVGRAHQIQRDFVANVSHDLKTPLTSIQGFSQAMLDGATKTQADYRQATSIINTEAQRMNRMVTELLSLASLQNGLSSLDMRPVQVAPMLAQLVLTMQPQAEQAGVDLSAQFQGSGALVLADLDRIKQAFSNLVENALKYTPAGGRVTVRLADAPNGVGVEIEDTGRGIPEQELKRVTERFYQVDKSRSTATDGRSLGLGLAIAQEIIHAHGGQIGVVSKEGIGTTIRVTLPGQISRQSGPSHGSWPRHHSEPKNGNARKTSSREVTNVNGNGYSISEKDLAETGDAGRSAITGELSETTRAGRN